MSKRSLSPDLRNLEAEAIYIFRQVAAEFRKPVLLYSIGKDSSVLLHLARKAFFPAPPPFPLLHIDTTWKFREMIAFRDETARQLGLDLIVHVNREGLGAGHQSAYPRLFILHSCHEDRSAEAGTDRAWLRCRVRRCPPRRRAEPLQGACALVPLGQSRLGPKEPA